MLSEGLRRFAQVRHDMWHKSEAKCICEGVTLSLNPPLRFHPRPDKPLYFNFKTIE